MKCIVTGVAGFIGSHLAEYLLDKGIEVVGIDCFVDYYPREVKERNLKASLTNSRFKFIESDLNSLDLKGVLEGATYVFHQAAQAGVRASWGNSFDGYTHHNILATQRLLEAAKGNTSIKKIVYASSSSIYGDAEAFPTSEGMRPQPISPYGVTKLAAEHLMSLYAKEFAVPTVSLRYFTVFGPRQRPDMAFHRFIRAALTDQEIALYGTGEQIRDFTFISDIVDANFRAAELAPSGAIYNLGGGTSASVNDVFKIIESKLGRLKIKRHDRQKGDAFRTCADTNRARSEIGFNPKVGLEEGIKREISWLSSEIKGA